MEEEILLVCKSITTIGDGWDRVELTGLIVPGAGDGENRVSLLVRQMRMSPFEVGAAYKLVLERK